MIRSPIYYSWIFRTLCILKTKLETFGIILFVIFFLCAGSRCCSIFSLMLELCLFPTATKKVDKGESWAWQRPWCLWIGCSLPSTARWWPRILLLFLLVVFLIDGEAVLNKTLLDAGGNTCLRQRIISTLNNKCPRNIYRCMKRDRKRSEEGQPNHCLLIWF